MQNLLSSILLSKNIKIRIYTTTIFPVVLYGRGTSSLTLWEELRLMVCENRVLRRIFGPKRDETAGCGEDYITRSLMLSTPHQIYSGE